PSDIGTTARPQRRWRAVSRRAVAESSRSCVPGGTWASRVGGARVWHWLLRRTLTRGAPAQAWRRAHRRGPRPVAPAGARRGRTHVARAFRGADRHSRVAGRPADLVPRPPPGAEEHADQIPGIAR